MANDFINFKSKENRDSNSMPMIVHSNTRTDSSLPSIVTKRNTPPHNTLSKGSNKFKAAMNSNERLKDFLFNPEMQGKGRCHKVIDPFLCLAPEIKSKRNSVHQVKFNDFMNRRVGDRRAQIFIPSLNPASSNNLNGSLLKNLAENKPRFSIHHSRNSVKQFLNALDSFKKQSKNRTTNINGALTLN
jgi:hypothetical protein